MDPISTAPFQNITLLLGKALLCGKFFNLANANAPEYLVDLIHALCIDWKAYASVTVSVAEYSPLPDSLDVLVEQLANILLRIVDALHAQTHVTSWQQDYGDLLLLRDRLASEFGSLWLQRAQQPGVLPDNFLDIDTFAGTATSPSLLEYLHRFRSTPFAVPAEFAQTDWVSLTAAEGLQHLEVLAAVLGHEWSRTVKHDGSSELVLLVRLWCGLMEFWYTVSAEAKTQETAELLSRIDKCQRSVSGALIRWSSKGIIRVAFYGPHLSGKTTTLNALIGSSALSTTWSTRCPCRVQHVPKLQEPCLEFYPEYFMIAIQCMRQRNISTVYQAWLTASPANQCDLGDFPPLPRDAVDILLRICGPSFDLPARVTGSATIRAMLNILDHVVYFCGIFNISFPIHRLPWPLLKVEVEWLAGFPNESWEFHHLPPFDIPEMNIQADEYTSRLTEEGAVIVPVLNMNSTMLSYWEEGMKTLKRSGVMRLPCVLATGRDACTAEDPDGKESTREIKQALEMLSYPGTPILTFSPTCALGANHLLRYLESCPQKPSFEDIWAVHTDPQEIALMTSLFRGTLHDQPAQKRYRTKKFKKWKRRLRTLMDISGANETLPALFERVRLLRMSNHTLFDDARLQDTLRELSISLRDFIHSQPGPTDPFLPSDYNTPKIPNGALDDRPQAIESILDRELEGLRMSWEESIQKAFFDSSPSAKQSQKDKMRSYLLKGRGFASRQSTKSTIANVPEDPDLIAQRSIIAFLKLLQTALADLRGILAFQNGPPSDNWLSNDQDLIKRLCDLLLETPSSRLLPEMAKDQERSNTPSSTRKGMHHVRFWSTTDTSRPLSRTFNALSRPFRRDRSAIASDEHSLSSTSDQVMTEAIKEIKGYMMKQLSLIMLDATPKRIHDRKAQARAGLSLAIYGNSIAALMALNHIVALDSLDGNTAPLMPSAPLIS